MKIVFGPVIAPAAWAIGESLLPNIVLTPHAAGPTWESWPKRFANSYANVERVARGEAPLWVVPELR